MRRTMAIAAFALLLGLPVWAQHGGGHGGGGGHAGGGGHSSFGGGHSSFSGGHSSSFGTHSFSTPHSNHFSGNRPATSYHRGVPLQTSLGHGPFLHDGYRHSGFRRFAPFRNGFCWSFPCWGWGSAYYDPWYWDWSADDYSFDRDYYDNLATANEMNEQSLEQQRMLRQEEADGDQDSYNLRYPQRYSVDMNSGHSPSAEKPGAPAAPPTVLVFRDQHKEEIQNYAIIGQTLWNFAPQRTERISLATVDVPATVKANDDRGVTFRIPGAQSQ